MSDLFKAFPGLPCLLGVLLLVPFAARPAPRGFAVPAARLLGAAIAASAGTALLLACANLLVPDYVDNVEPTVVANGWIWAHGGALYPALAPGDPAPELRGLLYGPLTFEWASLPPLLLGPSVFATKLPAALLFLATVAMTLAACRRAGAPFREAALATAAMTAVLGISEAPYWARADSALIFFGAVSALTLPGATARVPPRFPWRRALLLGALAGAASAMKLHGAAYVAPACLVAAAATASWRRGLGLTVVAALAGLAAFALPFLPSGVPVRGFLFYFGLAARHGLSLTLFGGNLTLLAAICLPVLLLARLPSQDRPDRGTPAPERPWPLLAVAAAACALAVAAIASKPGAGYPHLLPFLPYAAVLFSRVLASRALCRPRRRTPEWRTLALGVLFLLAFGAPVLVRAATFAGRGAAWAKIRAGGRQIERVLAAHPGETVAVGYGGNSFGDLRLSYLRVLPVFAGQPLPYDATAMDDLWQGGVSRAMALAALERCAIRVWLIPGDQPFAIRDFYGGTTFPDAFRRLFAARYRMQPEPAGADGGPFRVWLCAPPA